MKLDTKSLNIVLVISLIVLVKLATAAIGIPMFLSGDINSGNAPIGMLIEAKINNDTLSSSSSFKDNEDNTIYGLVIAKDDITTPEREGANYGEEIQIFVENIFVDSFIWYEGNIETKNIVIDTSLFDQDNDNIIDRIDNCINTYNPNQINSDSDIYGNLCDNDDDNDNILDNQDNCQLTYNPNQLDSDNDGIGNLCDSLTEPDQDNDGISDNEDLCSDTLSGLIVDLNGCSCNQKSCDDFNVCTNNTCNLETAECITTNMPWYYRCGDTTSIENCGGINNNEIIRQTNSMMCGFHQICEATITEETIQTCSSNQYCNDAIKITKCLDHIPFENNEEGDNQEPDFIYNENPFLNLLF